MIGNIAKEFQEISKFNLLAYFTDYRDFIQEGYGGVYAYYSGKSESVNHKYISQLEDLLSRSVVLLKNFQTFSGKLGNVGYWELQQYCEDLFDTLQHITKLPKYLRTSKTKRGYKPVVQANYAIGAMKTVADAASEIGGNETDMILNNDLEEKDWSIDKLSNIQAMVNNNTDVVVETILEAPIGKNVYGHDIKKKLKFWGGDLEVIGGEDNIEQKAETLCELQVGDVPEYPNWGREIPEGVSSSALNYASILNELNRVFSVDDIFDGVSLADVSADNGDITMTLNITTQYSYSTSKTITV